MTLDVICQTTSNFFKLEIPIFIAYFSN